MGNTVTVTRAVAIRIANVGVIVMKQGLPTTVNGLIVSQFPYNLPADGSRITKVGTTTRVFLANSGVVVQWDGSHFVQIKVPPQYSNLTCGLCGRYNGDPSDDLEGKDGTIYYPSHPTYSSSQTSRRAYHSFGVSWEVTGSDRMILDSSDLCQDFAVEPLHPCHGKTEIQAAAEKYCSWIKDPKGPYSDCHPRRDPEETFRSCVFDICGNNGDTSVACDVAKGYETFCRRTGITTIGSVVDSCGMCFGDGTACKDRPTCQASGDPHYTTFDNVGHHFQGICEYVLVQDCRDQDFAVHVQNNQRGRNHVSWTKAVAVTIRDSGVIRLLPNRKVTINSRVINSFPYRLQGDGTVVSQTNLAVEVTVASIGVTISFDGVHLVEVTVPEEYKSRTCGLCGIFDGNSTNDLSRKDGTVLLPSHPTYSSSTASRTAYHSFGISWAVQGTDRLLLDPTDKCRDSITPPPPPCNGKPQVEADAKRYCQIIADSQGPYGACHASVDFMLMIESCVFDLCACDGDESCGCDAVQAYEAACRRLGISGVGTILDECGVCFGDGSSCAKPPASCQALGDPHYSTFDKAGHHFQGQCEYILAKDCSNNDFSVHVRNEHRHGNSRVTYTRSVAIKIPGVALIKLLPFKKTIVNSFEVTKYPHVIGADGSLVKLQGRQIRVMLASSGVEVIWNGDDFVKVVVPEKYRDRVCGLCGTFDGNADNDLQLRNGTVLHASHLTFSNSGYSMRVYHDFGRDWSVHPADRLLVDRNASCADFSIPPLYPCDTMTGDRAAAEQKCAAILSQQGPYAACHATVDPYLYYQSCLYDTCACDGILNCACGAVYAYEDACREEGVRDMGSVIDECGVCFGDGSTCLPVGSTCQASGDPHYATLDGAGHHFQGQCEYVLVQDCANNDFSVHVRNEHRGSQTVTWTNSVAIRIAGGAIIKLVKNSVVYVNGREIKSFPKSLSPDGTVLRKVGRLVKVQLGNSNVLVTWDGDSIVEVTVPLAYRTKTCGLCGQYDGMWQNDLELANGSVVHASHRYASSSTASVRAYHLFGVSWAVNKTNRLLLSPTDTCNDSHTPVPHPCELQSTSVKSSAQNFCSVIKDGQGPYSACHEFVDPILAYESCVFDTCGCDGDTACACRSVLAYELSCKDVQVSGLGTVVDECGVCFGDGSRCVSFGATAQASGDPHYLTCDKSGHHFMGKCEYVFMKDLVDGDFQVHVRNEDRGNPSVSWTRDVAIKSRGGAVIHILKGGIVRVNGITVVSFPHYVAVDGSWIRRVGSLIRVFMANSGVTVAFDGNHFMEVNVPDKYMGRVGGLSGDYNGNFSDDLQGSDGTVYHPSNRYYSTSLQTSQAYNWFGISWAVNSTDRLILSPTDICVDSVVPPPHPCDGKDALRSKAENYCRFITISHGAYGSCHSVIVPDMYFESCVFDSCACQETFETCACASVRAYEAACVRDGVTDLGSVIDECGQCFGDGTSCEADRATCQVSGDTHYTTFDNSGHHFRGGCEYVLAKDCSNNSKWTVHVRNQYTDNETFTLVRSVAIRISGVGVIRMQGQTVDVNRILPTRFPYVLPGDGSVVRKEFGKVKVFLANANVVVRFDGNYLVELSVPSEYMDQICGLCGTYNRNSSDDLQLLNKSVVYASHRFNSVSNQSLSAYHTFGLSWAVSNGDRLLIPSKEICKDASIPIPHPCEGNANLRRKAEERCDVLINPHGPYRECHGVTDESSAFKSCVHDTCACGDRPECYCDTLRAYEEMCKRRGVSNIGTVLDECGVCFGDGSSCAPSIVCQASGDPHYRTFDGFGHHFQGLCEYILAKDCKGTDFSIHVRNEPLNNIRAVSYTRGVAVKVKGMGVIQMKNNAAWVNGVLLSVYPYYVGSHAIISRHSQWIVVRLSSSGVRVRYDGSHFAEVAVPESYVNNTCGLCGFYNGEAMDDLRSLNGTIFSASDPHYSSSKISIYAYHSFGISWTVSGSDRLLLDAADECVDNEIPPAHPCDGQAQMRARAEKYCRFISNPRGPYGNCHSIVNPSNHYESCVFDTCACNGDTKCACDSVVSYETICRQSNVTSLGSVVDECGVCFGDGTACANPGATCQVAGGPNYITFDNAAHHFEGYCEYLLVGNAEFSIHIQNGPCCQKQHSTVRRCGINIRKVGVVVLNEDQTVLVNGIKVETFPYTIAADGSRVRMLHDRVRVWLANSGVIVLWDGRKSFLQVDVPMQYTNNTIGLCGKYNNDLSDDLTLRNGSVMMANDSEGFQSRQSRLTYYEFGVSWAMEGKDRLFLNASDVCVDPIPKGRHACVFNSTAESTAEEYCSFITDKRGPYSSCHSIVNSQTYYESCLSETCLCQGDKNCACNAITAYETVCRLRGLKNLGTVIDLCGVCFGDGTTCKQIGATCQASGDPHYVTFDGLGHHFQGRCEYILAEDCHGDSFKIHVRNIGNTVTVTKAVAIKISGVGYLTLLEGLAVEMNGIGVNQFPYTVPGDGSQVYASTRFVRVHLASSGVVVLWDGNNLVEVTVPLSYMNRTCGLCGQFNGVMMDDMKARNGTVYTPSNPYYSNSDMSTRAYHSFGVSWAVAKADWILIDPAVNCVDPDNPPAHPCDHKPSVKQQAKNYCRIINDVQGPYGNCHAVIPPANHFESCVFDTCQCDGCETAACDAIRAYEMLCRQQGVTDVGSVVDECNVCFGDGTRCEDIGATCIASGDPHYTTFDGAGHHFQGKCEYIFSEDCSLNKAYSVHVRNEDRGNAAVTWTKSVAIRAPRLGTLLLLPNGVVIYNTKEITTFPRTTPDGSRISKRPGSTRVRLSGSDVIVTWDGNHIVQVAVPTGFSGKTCGLCGLFDDDYTNDLTLRNGSVVHPSHKTYSSSKHSFYVYHVFGTSWVLPHNQSLLLNDEENCVDNLLPAPHPCDGNEEIRSRAEEYCNFVRDTQGPYASCHDVVDPLKEFESCVFDVCSCGGAESCACDAVKSYEIICRREGVNDLGSVIDECGVCFGDGSSCEEGVTCQAHGDPHYSTFDGAGHHFQGQCEYILAKDCVSNDFSVHVRNEHRGNPSVTWTRSVAIRVEEGSVILLLPNRQTKVNGRHITRFPYVDGVDGTRISRLRSNIRVWLANSGVVVRWDGAHLVEVTVPDTYRNRTCGLCGRYDGNYQNDLQALDGSIFTPSNRYHSSSNHSLSSYHTFGRSWAVVGSQRLLLRVNDSCVDPITHPSHPCSVNPQFRAKAKTFCSFITQPQGLYADCQLPDPVNKTVPPLNANLYYETCVFDTCAARGDTSVGCYAVKAYESECRRHGADIGSVVDDCGVCFGDGSSCAGNRATCTVSGDPHYSTFDGAGHHFQGKCEYILAKDCRDGNFAVHVRNEHRHGNNRVTYTRSVAVRARGLGVIKMLQGGVVTVNGHVVTTFPRTLTDGSRLTVSSGIFILTLTSDVEIRFDGSHFVQVEIAGDYMSAMCGLCGNYDSEWRNDLKELNGTVQMASARTYSASAQSVKAYHDFGVSYAVNGKDRLLLNATEQCQDPGTPPKHPCDATNNRSNAEHFCSVISDPNGPYVGCQTIVDLTEAFESCVFDVCGCFGNESCGCKIIQTFEMECKRKGGRGIGTIIDVCGVCNGDGLSCLSEYGQCTAFGDPHYITFDRYSHHFQGRCEYVFAQDCVGGDFSIHVQNENRSGNAQVSYTKAIAVKARVAGIIKLFKDYVDVNGQAITVFPHRIGSDGTIITKRFNRFSVRLGLSGVSVDVSGVNSYVKVWVPPVYKMHMCGLCGTFDGNSTNDLRLRDGSEVLASNSTLSSSQTSKNAYHSFGTSWTVATSNRLLIPSADVCSDGAPPLHPCDAPNPNLPAPSERWKQAESKCQDIADPHGPYGDCHEVLNPQMYFESCLYDVCGCGLKSDCACSAVIAYELECQARGVTTFQSIVDNCGVCHGDGFSCRTDHDSCGIFSDPNAAATGAKQAYYTFDNLRHFFQGKCEYLLARDCVGNLFSIHVENDFPRLEVVHTAWTTGLAINAVGLGLIKIHHGLETEVYFNGKLQSRPATIRGIDGSQLVIGDQYDDFVEITLASSDVQITRYGNKETHISIPRPFMNRMCGLCGNYNGNPLDDLLLPNGVSLNVSNVNGSDSEQSVASYHKLGSSWAVDGNERLILTADDNCQDPKILPYCERKPKNKEVVEEFCKIILDRGGPFSRCHRLVKPQELYENCVLDSCSDGNLKRGCSAIISYQKQCERRLRIRSGLGPILLECSKGIL